MGEVEVVKGGACLVEVGRVDIVPAALEGVALALDVVGEGSALSEWVVLLLYKRGVVLGKNSKLVKGGRKNSGVLSLEDGLGLSGDY